MNFRIYLPAFAVGLGMAASLPAATYNTTNFQASADTPRLAKAVAETAEGYRRTLAERWLGKPLNDWTNRCQIEVVTKPNGGSGWTSYTVKRGEVERLHILLNGPSERLLEFVLSHEIMHAILVTSMGQALPRWADEGAAMMAESQSQRGRQRLLVEQLLQSDAALPLRRILDVANYPHEDEGLRAFYAQSMSLTEFLISQGSRARFLQFARDGQAAGWDQAIALHYKHKDVESLQTAWRDWVVENSLARQTLAQKD